MVFGEDGRALTTWSSTKKKNGKRYRYYISARDTKEFAGASGLPRLPAAELEAVVVEQLRAILRSPPICQKASELCNIDEAKVTVALSQIDEVWEQLFPNEQTRIVQLLIKKVIVTPSSIDIRLRNNGIEKLVLEITDPLDENEVAA